MDEELELLRTFFDFVTDWQRTEPVRDWKKKEKYQKLVTELNDYYDRREDEALGAVE